MNVTDPDGLVIQVNEHDHDGPSMRRARRRVLPCPETPATTVVQQLLLRVSRPRPWFYTSRNQQAAVRAFSISNLGLTFSKGSTKRLKIGAAGLSPCTCR